MSFAKREPETKQLQDAPWRVVNVAISQSKIAQCYGKKGVKP